jgi:hypothetical protein
MTFAIYSQPIGGKPLWQETQNVAVGEDGRFEVLLGSASEQGLSEDLFGTSASGAAISGWPRGRWLGIRVGQEPEPMPRVALASVPYGLKAADSEKLGGRPISEFVPADELQAGIPDASTAARGAVTTGSQSFAGLKTFSSGILATSVNNVMEADQFPGENMGEQLTSCLTALASTGGVCDARGITGSQVASSTVAIPANVQLLLGAVTLTSTANPAFTVNNGSSVVGLGQGVTRINLNSATGTAIRTADRTIETNLVLLHGFSLADIAASTSSVGIDGWGLSDSKIQDVWVNAFATQLLLNGNASVNANGDDYVHVYFSARPGSGFNGVVLPNRYVNAQRFFGARFSHLGNQLTIGSTTDGPPTEVNCFGCTFEGAETAAVNVVNGISMLFSGGRFQGNATAVQTAANYSIRGLVVDSPAFINNTRDMNDQAAAVNLRGNGAGADVTYAGGLSTSAGMNLMPNAMMEGWSGTTDLLGWSSLQGTNWDATGDATQERRVKNSGCCSVKAGDGVHTLYGVNTTNPLPIDSTKPYTLSLLWATSDPDTTVRVAFRLFDRSGNIITTGTVVADGIDSSTDIEGFYAVMTYRPALEAHILGSDLTATTAYTLQRFSGIFRFPSNTASVRFGILDGTTSTKGFYVYMDDVYFAEGQASTLPTAGPLGDSGLGGTVTLYSSLAAEGGVKVDAASTPLQRIAKYKSVLSPAAVAAHTCSEQQFTVPGVQGTDGVIVVNKPSAQAGLGIKGVRAAGANSVGVNFCNTTASPITPLARETYLFAVLQ